MSRLIKDAWSPNVSYKEQFVRAAADLQVHDFKVIGPFLFFKRVDYDE